jgi:hypothetical protein
LFASIPWQEAVRDYRRAYGRQDAIDPVDVLRWLTTIQAAHATLKEDVRRRDETITLLMGRVQDLENYVQSCRL